VGGIFCTLLFSPAIVGPTRAEFNAQNGLGPDKCSSDGEPDNLDKLSLYFGTLLPSLYTHFVLITTEGWIDIAEPVMEVHGGIWALYFIGYIMVTNFSLLNMVVAVITEKILALGQEESPREQLQYELEAFRACLTAIFSNIDEDKSMSLSQDELRRLFDDRQFRRVLEAFEVNCTMPFEYIWPIIDVDGSGMVTFDEFMTACLRLRGSRGKSNFQVLMLQCDVMKLTQRLSVRQEELHDELTERLTGFETLISKLSKCYTDDSKPATGKPREGRANSRKSPNVNRKSSAGKSSKSRMDLPQHKGKNDHGLIMTEPMPAPMAVGSQPAEEPDPDPQPSKLE